MSLLRHFALFASGEVKAAHKFFAEHGLRERVVGWMEEDLVREYNRLKCIAVGECNSAEEVSF
jgi:hypothetical protein